MLFLLANILACVTISLTLNLVDWRRVSLNHFRIKSYTDRERTVSRSVRKDAKLLKMYCNVCSYPSTIKPNPKSSQQISGIVTKDKSHFSSRLDVKNGLTSVTSNINV